MCLDKHFTKSKKNIWPWAHTARTFTPPRHSQSSHVKQRPEIDVCVRPFYVTLCSPPHETILPQTANHFCRKPLNICGVNQGTSLEQQTGISEVTSLGLLPLPSSSPAPGAPRGIKEGNWCMGSLMWIKENHRDCDLMCVSPPAGRCFPMCFMCCCSWCSGCVLCPVSSWYHADRVCEVSQYWNVVYGIHSEPWCGNEGFWWDTSW